MTKLDPLAYIRDLDLGPFDAARAAGAPLALADDKEEGYVDAGQLVAFAAGVSARSKADVLNSMLLAQLAANVKADREDQTEEWYKKYREVLENVGWAIAAFDFVKTKIDGSTFQVKAAVLALIAALATENGFLVAKATIAAVEALGEGDDRVALFASSSSNSGAGNFQVGAVIDDRNSPQMSIAASHFKASDVKTNFLWFTWKTSSIELYQAKQNIVLSESVYGVVREEIIKKLGDKAKTYVADLDIGDL